MALRRAAAALAVVVVVSLGPTPPSSAAPSEPAAALFELVNATRSHFGVAPLAWRDDIAVIATAWSAQMALTNRPARNDLYFSDAAGIALGAGARGENVTAATTIEEAHAILMEDPQFRANILQGDFTEAGFGAVQDLAGLWWVTEDFLRPSSAGDPVPGSAPEIGPELGEPMPALERLLPPLADPPSRPPPHLAAAPEPSRIDPKDRPRIEIAPRRPRGPSSAVPAGSRGPAAAVAVALVTLGGIGHLGARSYLRSRLPTQAAVG